MNWDQPRSWGLGVLQRNRDGTGALQKGWPQLMGWAHKAVGGDRCQAEFGGPGRASVAVREN